MTKELIIAILEEFKSFQIIQEKGQTFEIKHDMVAGKINDRATTRYNNRFEVTRIVYETKNNGGNLTEKHFDLIDPDVSKLALQENDKEEILLWIAEQRKNMEDAKEEKIKQQLKLKQQFKNQKIFLIVSCISLVITLFALAGTFILNKNSKIKDHQRDIEDIRNFYEEGNQKKSKDMIERIEKNESVGMTASNMIMSVLENIKDPVKDDFQDSLTYFKKTKFLFDSFFTDFPVQNTSQNKIYKYATEIVPTERGFTIILKLFKKGEEIYKDTMDLTTAFFSSSDTILAYQKDMSIVNLYISQLPNKIVFKKIKLNKYEIDPKQNILDLKFDSSDSYLYASINQKSYQVFNIKKDKDNLIDSGKFTPDTVYNINQEESYRFTTINKIVKYVKNQVAVIDLAKNKSIKFIVPLNQTDFIFPYYKTNKLLILNNNKECIIWDILNNKAIDTLKNLNISAYKNIHLTDSTFFPVYTIANNSVSDITYIYSTLTDKNLDTINGKAENIQVSDDYSKILYLQKGIPFVKRFTKKETSFPNFKILRTYGFFNNFAYLVNLNNSKSSYYDVVLFNFDTGTQTSLNIPLADKWDFNNKIENELIFFNPSTKDYGSLNLKKIAAKK